MLKAVIFDMDGVLIDSERVYVDQIKELFDNIGKEYTEEYIHSFVGTCDQEMELEIHDFVSPEYTGKTFMDTLHKKNKDDPMDFKGIMIPGVYEVLKNFKDKGYKIGLASSSPMKTIDTVLNELNIADYFDTKTTGYDLKESKPNPEIYNVTLEKLGVSADEAIAIEDSMFGITAAKAAGIYTLALKDTRFGMDQSSADVLLDQLVDAIEVANKRGA